MVQYRKKKRLPWQIQVRGADGSKKTRSFLTKDDALKAEMHERRRRQLERAGLEAPAEEILFVDYAATWMQRRFKAKVAGTAMPDESKLRRVWIPAFGHKPLGFITTAEIREVMNRLQFEEDLAPSTIDRHRACLHKLFNDARAEGKIPHNPVSPIRLQNEPRTSFVKTWLKSEEDQVAYIQGLTAEGPDYGMVGWALLWTGGRISEAVALQYQDIDEKAGVVRIRRIEERFGGSKIVQRTKGKDKKKVLDETVVPLAPVYLEAIKRHMQRSRFTRPTDFIACRANGSYIPYDTFKDIHARVIKRLELPEVTIHGMRRTFATNAKRAGFSRADIKDMLGHSTEAMTEKYVMDDADHLVHKAKKLKFGAVAKAKKNVIQLRGAKR
jgi:integrase